MNSIFRFKNFNVDQTNCAMKVGTDSVLLGAMADNEQVSAVLDIGTGTGVIALMLTQRFPEARIDAVEIDEAACHTAEINFKTSAYSERLHMVHGSFQNYFRNNPSRKYDLIVSNPPFFINSLPSGSSSKNLARHTNSTFFEELVAGISSNLQPQGLAYLILPPDTSTLVRTLLSEIGNLKLVNTIYIRSFPGSNPHRCILVIGWGNGSEESKTFTIYKAPKVYTEEYQELLHDFLTIF